MRIEHIAIWTKNIEAAKAFYQKYFSLSCSDRYVNTRKGFQSYFLSFPEGPRIELMQMDAIPHNQHSPMEQYTGLIHFAISLGTKAAVDNLTARFKTDGIIVVDGPRTTGDGYYESVVLDPEGNRIELTA